MSCVPAVAYTQSSTNGGGVIATGYQYLYGVEVQTGASFIGKSVDYTTFYLGKNGSPQGVLTAQIYSGSVGSSSKTLELSSTTTLDISTISTSDYTFDFSTYRNLQAGDVVALALTTNTSTSLSNRVDISYFSGGMTGGKIVTTDVASPTTFYEYPSGYGLKTIAGANCVAPPSSAGLLLPPPLAVLSV